MNKLLYVVTLVAMVSGVSVPAQFYQSNARISGLGGTYIIDDVTDILRYPLYVNEYRDYLQATFNSPIIGVKSVNDLISIGIVANRGLLLDNSASGFYQTASAMLSATVLQAPKLSAQYVPHVIVGVDLSAVSLGFDVFYEYASSHYESDATADTTEAAHIRNPGIIASARVGEETIPVTVKFGLSFPSISGNVDIGTTEMEVKSDKGLYWLAGAEGLFTVSDFRLTVGTEMHFESYAYTVDDNDPASLFNNKRLAFYAGLEGDLFTSAHWGVVPTLYYMSGKRTTVVDTTTNGSFVFSINSGMENTWTSVWVFDELYARGGLMFSSVTPGEHKIIATVDSKKKEQTTYQPVTPTVGIGVKKKTFQLDVTLNPAAWGAVLTGPAVGMVTATFNL